MAAQVGTVRRSLKKAEDRWRSLGLVQRRELAMHKVRPTSVSRRAAARTAFSIVVLLMAPARAVGGSEDGDAVVPPSAGDVLQLNVNHLEIQYKTASASGPVDRAELWCISPGESTWRRCMDEGQGGSPMVFEPREDGLYGLYVVLLNGAGASNKTPGPGTRAQRWVRIDRSAPVVQLLELRADERFDLNRELRLRWKTEDDNLGDRPVVLSYRTEQTRSYQPVAKMLTPNGIYRWTVPQGVSGRLEIKITATDRAGNRGRCVADWLRVQGDAIIDTRPRGIMTNAAAWRNDAGDAPTLELGGAQSGTGAMTAQSPTIRLATDSNGPMGWAQAGLSFTEPDALLLTISEAAAKQAREKYELGTWHRLRGEHEVAVLRLREALAIDPEMEAARNDLAGLLILRGDLDAAEQELNQVLASKPRYAPALRSLALVHASKRNYRSAEQCLEKLLLIDPKDAEAWLHIGDVKLFLGDRRAARDAWTRGAAIEAASDETRQRANRRLELYPPAPS